MADIKYNISFDLGSTLDITAMVNKAVFPLLHQAVNAIGKQTAENWKEAVYKAKLWSGEKDAYAQSITWKMTGYFSGYVEATYKHAEEIETGRPARDLKKMLDTSMKVRRSEKNGKRFLVIPMRHNTTGNGAHAKAMPASVHAMAQALSKSMTTGSDLRPVGEMTWMRPGLGMGASAKQTPFLSNPKTKQHSMTAKMSYAWGDRLSRAAIAASGPQVVRGRAAQAANAENKKAWLAANKNYAGMVRMDTSTPGGAKSSAFLTFRIMMEGQKGWVVPAQPGQYIAKKVAEDMQPKAEKVFQEAIKKTVVVA